MTHPETCSICGADTLYLGKKTLYTDKGWVPDVPERLDMEMYVCRGCAHVEMFSPALLQGYLSAERGRAMQPGPVLLPGGEDLPPEEPPL